MENCPSYLYTDIQRNALYIISHFSIKCCAEFVLVEIQFVGTESKASADFTLDTANLTICNCGLAGLSITLHET